LLARAIEGGNGDAEWQVARLTVELTRPVPDGRVLTLATDVERPGRRVSMLAARLVDDATVVAHVRALRIRRDDVELAPDAVEPDDPPPGGLTNSGQPEVSWAADRRPAFHADACEHRFAEGSWDEPGPIAGWIRLVLPVVEGEEPSGVQRVAAAADFGNGISAGLPHDRFVFINPDLTIHLLRPPTGDWIGLRTSSFYGLDGRSTGAGMAESALYDQAGRIGRSVQSLFVERRS
jgi:hypothetical protein